MNFLDFLNKLFTKKGKKRKSKILLLLIQYGGYKVKNLAKTFLSQVLSNS